MAHDHRLRVGAKRLKLRILALGLAGAFADDGRQMRVFHAEKRETRTPKTPRRERTGSEPAVPTA